MASAHLLRSEYSDIRRGSVTNIVMEHHVSSAFRECWIFLQPRVAGQRKNKYDRRKERAKRGINQLEGKQAS